MAEAKSRDNWAHTSALLAMTANCNRDPKKTRPFSPTDFDPHASAEKQIRLKGSIEDLKVFVDKKRSR